MSEFKMREMSREWFPRGGRGQRTEGEAHCRKKSPADASGLPLEVSRVGPGPGLYTLGDGSLSPGQPGRGMGPAGGLLGPPDNTAAPRCSAATREAQGSHSAHREWGVSQ